MEPKVIRTLKKGQEGSRLDTDSERRLQISDDILDIIYDKVVTRHKITRIQGRGIRALIDDHEE